MIKRIFDWLKQPLGLVAVGIAFLALFSFAAYGIYQTQQSPEQPIQFPHKTHITLGVQCVYCHSGALRGASPGIPSTAKCWGCHQQIQKTLLSQDPNTQFPLLKPLVESVKSGQPVQWAPVARVPDFVQFNHRPHIAAGVNCEDCHGDLSKMTIYENPQIMNMGWCLQCHRAHTEDNFQNNPNQDPAVSAVLIEKRTRLLDCGTCHY